MPRLAPACFFAATFLMVGAPASAATVPDTLVVGFKAHTPKRHVAETARKEARHVVFLGTDHEVQISRLRHGLGRTTQELLQDPDVRYVERVRTTKGSAVEPSPDQWALENTGQFNGTQAADIDVERAWTIAGYGAGVPVGTIDSGVDFEQPAFAGLDIWVNPGEVGTDAQGRNKSFNHVDDDANGCVDDVRGCDFVDEDGEPDDKNGHGTSVMSVMAAPGTPGPVVGVAPRVRIVAARALDDYASGTTAMEARAINYLGRYGARVINISISGNDSLAVRNAIANYPDTLFVVAAGNDGVDNDGPAAQFPCSDPAANIVCVGASTPSDNLATFSNYGALRVDFAAPGERILAIKLNGSTGLFRGTSFAAPIVSGVAALMLGARPNATVAQLKDALKASVEVRPGLTRVRTHGRINAYNAVQIIRGVTPAPRPARTTTTQPPTAPTMTVDTPVASDSSLSYTDTSTLPHTIDVRSAAKRKGSSVTVTLRCLGTVECDGTIQAAQRKARRTSFSLAAGRTQTVRIKAKLSKRATRLPVAVTVDEIAVRHVVKFKRAKRR